MKTRIAHIALDKLVPHPDNPNWMSRTNFAKLVRNIKRIGRYEPLVVRPHPDKTGCFQIINGYHRWAALKEIGHETADAVVWDVDDKQTAILLATLNRLGGRDSLDRKVALLRRLRGHMPIQELSKLLPQTRGQLERLMAHKLLSRMTPRGRNPSPIPMIFFVNEAQQSAVEGALLLAANPDPPGDSSSSPAPSPAAGSTRAARRAAALTCLAHLFIDLTQQEPGR